MKGNFLDYLGAGRDQFNTDFCVASVGLFAMHGFGLVLSDSAKDIFDEWMRIASDWSLQIPDNGTQRDHPDPKILSHIKHAGILAHTVATSRPVAEFEPLTTSQVATLLDVGIPVGDKESETLMAFPHEYLALSVVDTMFVRYQYGRSIPSRVDWLHPPFSDHFRRNQCYLLNAGHISSEAMYMIYKTMDLYGRK